MAMQIRLSKDVEGQVARAPMTVDEFLARFPEVPRDLRDEPILAEYVTAFGHLLRLAQKPSACMRDGGDAPHQFYMRLLNDLAAVQMRRVQLRRCELAFLSPSTR